MCTLHVYIITLYTVVPVQPISSYSTRSEQHTYAHSLTLDAYKSTKFYGKQFCFVCFYQAQICRKHYRPDGVARGLVLLLKT